MRYPASERLEIIRIVEQSRLPAKLTLDELGIARRTLYRFVHGGDKAGQWIVGGMPARAL
jgi:putative transposase